MADRTEEYESMRCRFYENVYPELEEVVVVNVTEIGDRGAYVTLKEYNHIEGMILLSELSKRRIRSVAKLVKEGREEKAMVIRVDKEKGYIDLSKRRVDPDDFEKCEERYNKAKAVHGVMKHMSQATKIPVEDCYKAIGWPLYKKYGHAYDAFKQLAIKDSESDIFVGTDATISEEHKRMLIQHVTRNLAPKPVKIRGDIEVKCYTYAGIEGVQRALEAGEAMATSVVPIKIALVAPPAYVITSTTTDEELGVRTLNEAIAKIGEVIASEEFQGEMEIKMAPKTISQKEESELMQRLDELQRQQEEVDGDDSDDAEDE